MKNNIKIIFTMLCIGISANISGVDIEINNETMRTAYPEYNPKTIGKPDEYKLEGAIVQWAIGLVSQLTTQERTALA